MNSKLYSRAVEKFNQAANKAADKTLKDSLSNLKAETLYTWGDELKKNLQFDEAIEKFQEAFEASTVQEERSKYETDFKILQADKIVNEAKTLYDEGWAAEKNGNHQESDKKFKSAQQSFERASELDPNNFDFEQLFEIANLKLEGNQFYKEGVELLTLANELKQKHNFQEARNKMLEALDKFEQGYQASENDIRFKTSVELTKKKINETNQEITKLQLTSEQDNVSERERSGNKEESSSEGFFETLN